MPTRRDIPGPKRRISTDSAAEVMAEIRRMGLDERLLDIIRDYFDSRTEELYQSLGGDWMVEKREFAAVCRLQGRRQAAAQMIRSLSRLAQGNPMKDLPESEF